jgi:SdpI/YfhL protein family
MSAVAGGRKLNPHRPDNGRFAEAVLLPEILKGNTMTSQPFAVPALFFFIAAVPLVFGLIPPNRLYGFRIPKALSDDRVWYTVNRLGAPAVMVASMVYGVIAVCVPYHRSASDNFAVWTIHLAAFVLPLAIGLGVVVRYAKRL